MRRGGVCLCNLVRHITNSCCVGFIAQSSIFTSQLPKKSIRVQFEPKFYVIVYVWAKVAKSVLVYFFLYYCLLSVLHYPYADSV